jgi:hypothetical protein
MTDRMGVVKWPNIFKALRAAICKSMTFVP